ncbi:MAG: putative serine/threonine protein kinase, partial [Frankiales bacterium]|nr:putative serine/threonine protein kinase [Frankiales bacterium]
ARPAEATTSEHTTAFDVVEGSAPSPARPARVVRPATSPRRGWRAPAGAALALALAAGGVTVFVLQDHDKGSAAASPSAPQPPAVTAGNTERPAGVPADWRLHADPAGWSIWVPPSFQQGTNRDAVQLRDGTTRSTLRVRVVPGAASGPAIVTARESGFQTLGSYARVSLGPRDVPGLGATGELEFTFVDQVPLRVLDRGVVVDGVGYELYWQTPATSWAGARALADQIAATFRAPVRR